MKTEFLSQSGRFLLDLSGNDEAVMSAPTVRIQDRMAFAVDIFERTRVEGARLLAAAKELLSKIEADLARLQYSYSYRDEVLGGGGTGMTGGIRINGKIYSLKGGNGICPLEEIGIDASGRGYVAKAIDVRGEKVIETENLGRITITKRKKPLTIHRQLADLITFLEQQPDEYIVKSVYQGELKAIDLVRELQGGEGLGEEWIKERLHEFGDQAIRDLISYYGQSKYAKYRETIEYMLKNWYPAVVIQALLNAVLATKLLATQRQLYLGLLTATKQNWD
jgi:hypothetical protein